MTIVNVTGFSATNKGMEFNKINLSYEGEPLSYHFWDLEHIPAKAGVYVIYDNEGECLYVGSTPNRFNINFRIVEHIGSAYFSDYGHTVSCYLTEESVNDILLLERILIKALNPHFNNDQNDDEISKSGQEYIENYKDSTRKWQNWLDISEKDARRAGVPIEIVNLKNDIENVYDGVLGNIPYLIKGEVSLPSLYENVKKKLKLAQNKGYDIDFNDFVNIICEIIASDGLSDGQVGELVLTNKAFKQYIKKKK